MNTFKRIDYLDLALASARTKISLDKGQTQLFCSCNNPNLYPHSLHGDNSQLNTLIDLLIALGISFGKISSKENNCSFQSIEQKLDYIKNLQSDIFKKFEKCHFNDFPTRTCIEKLTTSLTAKGKILEKSVDLLNEVKFKLTLVESELSKIFELLVKIRYE